MSIAEISLAQEIETEKESINENINEILNHMDIDHSNQINELSNFNDCTLNNFNCNELYELNLAQLSLKLEAEFLVPVSTIQFLVEELRTVHSQRLTVVRNRLKEQLETLNITHGGVDKIVEEDFLKDPLNECSSKLGTNHKRKKFYKKI